jgi:hypothetical protein
MKTLKAALHLPDERRWHGRCLDASVGEEWGCAEEGHARTLDGDGGIGEPRLAGVGLRDPAAVVPAVSTPAADTANDPAADTADTDTAVAPIV